MEYLIFHLSFLIFSSLADGYMKSCEGGSVKCQVHADENYVVCNFESDTAKPDFSLVLILFLLY